MHMKISLEKWTLIFGIAGFLFSGYLSSIKFFSQTCAFHESCPFFLGYPACYYGFVMYTVIMISALLGVLGKLHTTRQYRIIFVTSLLGILFAGYFTLGELPTLFTKGLTAYVFGLPTCALGLIFYLILSFLSYKKLSSFTSNA